MPGGPPLCRPQTCVAEDRGPASSAGLSLTFAELTAARQQAKPQTSSCRCPMVRACLRVALPPAHGYLWGRRRLGARTGRCPWRVLSPSSSLCPFVQAGHTPGGVPRARRQLPPFPDWAKVTQVPVHTHSHTCAGARVADTGYLGPIVRPGSCWEQRQVAAGAGPGWVQSAPQSGSSARARAVLREGGVLCLRALLGPPPPNPPSSAKDVYRGLGM